VNNHVSPLVLIVAAWVGLGAQAPSVTHITFPTSGPPAAQEEFLRGVAALHNFEYEEANKAFVRARTAHPGFAMAYWGEAMSYHQTLWRNEDVAAGRRALAGLAPTAAARAARAGTVTERGYLSAVDALFGEGDSDTRRRAYAEAMGRLHESQPDDPEAATFYALALLGTASRSLIGYVDTHEGHSASLAGSETQRRVGEILLRVLATHPDHPGALHYLLHNYDDPEHAALALDAARAYAKVAMQSSHALHMPAHIFLQLGMWPEAEASDRAAFAASETWVANSGLPLTMRSYHSLSWRQYELLQLGRNEEAQRLIGVIEPVVKASGQLTLVSDLSSMRARYVVETRRWNLMANERNFGNINELCAIGFAAARSANPSLAELARQALAARSQAAEEGDLRPAAAIMERQVAATIALAGRQTDQAVAILQTAAAAERQLPPPLGLPIPLKPSAELLGEVLVEAGRPAEAVAAFQEALGRNRNRTLSVLGLARARAALGQRDEARAQYQQVLANLSGADTGLPEIHEANAYLATPPQSNWRPGARTLWAGLAALVAALAGIYWRQRPAHVPRAETAAVGRTRRTRRRK
jgi:tetratricopeptide (TPR) repeat protein